MSESLELFYRDHRQGMYSLAVAITGSHSLAEDAVQNAFAKLFAAQAAQTNRESGWEEIGVAYVYRTVRSAAIDLCRSGGRQARLKESIFNGYIRPSLQVDDPTQELMSQERHEQLKQAIDGLGDDQREAVVLKAYAELTFEQAGEIAGVPAKTIASRYRRALVNLEEKLKDET